MRKQSWWMKKIYRRGIGIEINWGKREGRKTIDGVWTGSEKMVALHVLVATDTCALTRKTKSSVGFVLRLEYIDRVASNPVSRALIGF